MTAKFPPCPYLPPSTGGMDWRCLSSFGRDRGADFYLMALRYGNHLWQKGYAARSILCLDRAFGAHLVGTEPVLLEWPLPYRAMAWLLGATPPGVFTGNPRVHFQHYAGRMNEPRRDQRRWRAWACWALARQVRPELPGDPKHAIQEPTFAEIEQRLRDFGLPGEAALWRHVLDEALPRDLASGRADAGVQERATPSSS